MPRSLARNNDADADSKDRDDSASTSEGSMPKSLIRKEHADGDLFEKEQEWESLSNTGNETRDTQDVNINKIK